jgi:hypothetical protein
MEATALKSANFQSTSSKVYGWLGLAGYDIPKLFLQTVFGFTLDLGLSLKRLPFERLPFNPVLFAAKDFNCANFLRLLQNSRCTDSINARTASAGV